MLDFGIPPGAGGGSWRLASGDPVLDDQGQPVADPGLSDIQAHFDALGEGVVLDGVHIAFFERHVGEDLLFEGAQPANVQDALDGVNQLLDLVENRLDIITARLAVQGPLAATYFTELDYDAATDTFAATTDRQLIPVYEAVFANAPATEAEALDWLGAWDQILNVIIGDYDRGDDHLKNSYSFLFANIVAAYESTAVPVGLPVSLTGAAGALGIPEELIVTGTGAGPETLAGTAEMDLFYMGAGDQTAQGGQDHDVYVFGRNFGQDIIDDHEAVGTNQQDDLVRFADTRADEVSARRENTDLILTVDATGDTVRILKQFEGPVPSLFGGDWSDDTGVAEIAFADGTVWDKIDIARAVADPQPGDQTIIGTETLDYLDGGAGNDRLEGGMDGDIYVFGRGYGNDVILDDIGNILIDSPDMIEMKAGIALSDLIFDRNGASDDLILRLAGETDTLTVSKQFDAAATGSFGVQWLTRIEGIVFDDGVSIDWRAIMDLLIEQSQTDGDDQVYGFYRSDRLDGGAGDDFLSGLDGGDTYVFGHGYGNDTIHDGQDSALNDDPDRLVFTRDVTPDQVTFARTGGNDDLIVKLDDGATVTLQDFAYASNLGNTDDLLWSLDDRIESFEFTDGTSWTWQEAMVRYMSDAKTDGDDNIYGFFHADTLDGGAGNDRLEGGNKGDTYVYDLGYGHDTIWDYQSSIFFPEADTIAFGAGLAPGDLSLSRSGDNLIFTVDATGETLTVVDQYFTGSLGNYYYDIEEFRFTDGTVWSGNDVMNLTLQGTAGDDHLVGFYRNDTLDGGAGNDRLEGGDAGDTYIFDIGYGHDTIFDWNFYVFADGPDHVNFRCRDRTGRRDLEPCRRRLGGLRHRHQRRPDHRRSLLGGPRHGALPCGRAVPLHRRHVDEPVRGSTRWRPAARPATTR